MHCSGWPKPVRKVRYAGALLFDFEGRVILQLRDSVPGVSHPGELSTFGGRVHENEALDAAVARELWEELRLVAHRESFELVGFLEHFDVVKGHAVAATYFALKSPIDVGALTCTEGSLVLLEPAAALTDHRVGDVTREMLRRVTFDSHAPASQLDTSDRLGAISMCLSYASYEANVYWQRNALYMGLNAVTVGGLVALYSLLNSALFLGAALLGMLLNWQWHHVNTYSKYLAERWREDARAIAREDPRLEESLLTLVGAPRMSPPPGPVPSVVMNRLARIFAGLWVLATAVGMAWFVTDHQDTITDLLGR